MAFIIFEGCDGIGKSTQIDYLTAWLRAKGIVCTVTREPGGTPLAEEVRRLFKMVPEHGDDPVPETELLLVMASRAQHVAKTIRPALGRGEWVICDRFLDSSYVFQGIRCGLAKEWIDAVAQPLVEGLLPNLVIVLSLDLEAAEKRRGGRVHESAGAPIDRLDGLDLPVQETLHKGFESLVSGCVAWPDGRVPPRVLVDASGTPEEIFERVTELVSRLLDDAERGAVFAR